MIQTLVFLIFALTYQELISKDHRLTPTTALQKQLTADSSKTKEGNKELIFSFMLPASWHVLNLSH